MMRASRSVLMAAALGVLGGCTAINTVPPKAVVERLALAPETARKRDMAGSRGAARHRGRRPGWSVAEGKRRARRRRNQLRHKARQ